MPSCEFERGFGKGPLVADADLPVEPQVDFYETVRTWAKSLPPDLRQALLEKFLAFGGQLQPPYTAEEGRDWTNRFMPARRH